MWTQFGKASCTLPRLLLFGCLCLTQLACVPKPQTQLLKASGIKPYWLKSPLPNTMTVMGESTDSLEAVQAAFSQARSLIIAEVIKQHQALMHDSLRDESDIQYHYRKFLLEQAKQNSLSGIQISGMPIDSSLVRDAYLELRRDKSRGRSFYRHYLNLLWKQAWTDSLVQEFYAFDSEINEILSTASYYADKPTDLSMIPFQIKRLVDLHQNVEDYRKQIADSLLVEYQSMYDRMILKAVNLTPTRFNLLLLLGDRHLTGAHINNIGDNCLKVDLIRETDEGFTFTYDDTYCEASAGYPLELSVLLPNGAHKKIQVLLPGNRVVLQAQGPLVLHYFDETKDGYAEMYMESVTGQNYYIRGLHFNGLHLNMAMNGRGRTIKGAGKYQLRAPIAQADFKMLLRSKNKTAIGGLIYTHPSSGIEIDHCFENLEIVLQKHK